ncbi:MAG: hypothetical protein QOI59_2522 [Gammaproteobacteria bacterium]|jgi:hypothetical protein|nr:hypothetical protein [Gammaproteobacteria bacterium]
MGHLRNLAILTVLAAFWPAWAATPSVAELLACTQVADATARLSCFDQRAAALSAAGTVAAPAPAKKLTPEQKIGLTRDKVDALETAPGIPPEPQLKNIDAALKSVSRDANNRQVFVLDNGQVWHQAQRDPAFSAKPGETVHISAGALGSFFLSTNPHTATRVTRVR